MRARWPQLDYGTALGVIRAAVQAARRSTCSPMRPRPFLQGARLTAWELQQDGIETTLITDNMAGHFLKSGRIGCVVVGADRIAANGDVANKIGTYSGGGAGQGERCSVLCRGADFDARPDADSGDQIPIEERASKEVTQVQGVSIAPEGIEVANPAFDVTPNRYVSAIITERGVARAPFTESLRKLASRTEA